MDERARCRPAPNACVARELRMQNSWAPTGWGGGHKGVCCMQDDGMIRLTLPARNRGPKRGRHTVKLGTVFLALVELLAGVSSLLNHKEGLDRLVLLVEM
eukprot:3993157-Pleurochrysis_carterae.AAC.2